MHDDDGKKAADALASKLVFRSIRNVGSVFMFRQMANVGLPHAATDIASDYAAMCREFAEPDEYAEMFRVDRGELVKLGHFDQAAKNMTESAIEMFKASVDAASLIFAHSLLDAAALDWCRVCSLARPTDFVQVVGRRRVSIEDGQRTPWLDLLKQVIDDYLIALEKESLLEKLDLLFRLCKPPPGFVGVEGYNYDRNRVLALDGLRHRYVHGRYPAERLPNGDADIMFLQQTNLFLLPLVHRGYGVRVDPSAVTCSE
jgi:hypothetical protein